MHTLGMWQFFSDVLTISPYMLRHVVTRCAVFVEEVSQVKCGIARRQVLRESLVAVAHDVVDGDEGLVNYSPVGMLRSLYQQISH